MDAFEQRLITAAFRRPFTERHPILTGFLLQALQVLLTTLVVLAVLRLLEA